MCLLLCTCLGLHQILALLVKCDNVATGCQWEGPFRELENHLLRKCSQCYIVCPKQCDNNGLVTVLRKNLKRHLSYKCPYRYTPDRRPESISSSSTHSEPAGRNEQLSNDSCTGSETCSEKSVMSYVDSDASFIQDNSVLVCDVLYLLCGGSLK